MNKIHPLLAEAPVTAIVLATGLKRRSAAEISPGQARPTSEALE